MSSRVPAALLLADGERVKEATQNTEPSVRLVGEVAALAEIFDPAVNIVTLRRARSEALIEEGRRALSETGFRVLTVARAGPAGLEDLREALAGWPHLTSDVSFWVDVLAEITGSERVGVRLARLRSAMCPRFHVDRVALRVVCTYEGRGTEYVSEEHVNRSRLGHAAEGAPDEASGLLSSPGQVLAAEPGDVVLLKGDTWAGNAGRAAVHRSPAASVASPRLVMTLDPL